MPLRTGAARRSASGKTTVAEQIIQQLDVPWVAILSMDSFYRVLSPEEHECAVRSAYNFDHPTAFDFELLVSTLQKLKAGKVPLRDPAAMTHVTGGRCGG